MIFTYFKKFFYFFKDYRKSFAKYTVLSLTAAIMELFGVALTYPFVLKLLSDKPAEKWYLSPLFIGIVIVLLFLFKNIFMIFYLYIQAKFLNKFGIMVRKRVMNFMLGSDYIKTSQISLAKKGKIFVLLIPNVINNFVLRLLNLNINLFIFAFITIFVAIKFPVATILSTLCAILLVYVQNKIYKPLLTKMSKNVSETALINGQSYNEAVLNIKNIKISNNEKYFYDNYAKTLVKHYENTRKMEFLTSIPPFIVEPFAIILLFVLLLVISYQNYTSPEKLVASFALIATAIFRLTPTISRIQVNLNGINSAMPMVKEFIDFYEKYDIKNVKEIQQKYFIGLNQSLELKNISFGYEPEKLVLNDINLTIKKGEFVGIAGLSGVGKTTLVDIISGLYEPNEGMILVDGEVKTNQIKIGYIPQEFSLISGTIRENVAFGNSDIDDERVIDALKKAQLYDFIEGNYKEGIYAKPFTDSIGMSQGQKQRMAIARALYSNPDLLILDEATSSLDLKTEDEICHVLNELKGDKTIIVIAHRLSTIKSADRIIFMENGKILAEGNFEELINKSEGFKHLVELAEFS